MRLPAVAIIVINWNSRECTAACLASLAQLTYREHRVILVDNGSVDGSPDRLGAQFPEADLIRNGTNLGFSGGINSGLRRARELGFDYYLLLNNDTTVAPDMLERLLEVAEEDAAIGGLSPLIFRERPPHRPWYAGGHFNWWICESRSVPRSAGGRDDQPRDVDFLTGCAMLLPARVVADLGPFDDRFFAYFEDVDYTARLREAGYRAVYVPAARMWHQVSATVASNRAANLTRRYVYRNRLLLMQKHAHLQHWAVFLPVYAFYYVGVRLIAFSLLRRWSNIGAMAAGIGDYFRVRRLPAERWG